MALTLCTSAALRSVCVCVDGRGALNVTACVGGAQTLHAVDTAAWSAWIMQHTHKLHLVHATAFYSLCACRATCTPTTAAVRCDPGTIVVSASISIGFLAWVSGQLA
jgi:hypothetical protein